MKNKNLVQFFFAALLVVGTTPALAGRESSGGGGNATAAEFIRFANMAGNAFFEHQAIKVFGNDFDHASFREVIKVLKIQITDQPLVLNGKSVTAINYPDQKLIILNEKGWIPLDADSKIQLVIHEILGLRYRAQFDDSNYQVSTILLSVTKQFTVESVALAMARAGSAYGFRMRIISSRTKVIDTRPDENDLGNDVTTEVAIQTFENSDSASVRVYHVKTHDMGGVMAATFVRLEGAAGG